MRLLVIVNVFHPDRGGGAAVFSDMCFALAERDIDVTVRCAYPYYPEWKDKSGKNGWRIQKYVEQGVQVERYGLYIPRDPNSLGQRLLYEASFWGSLMRRLHRGRSFDAVMVYCPLVGAVAFGVLNKWLHRKPLWLNVQDLSADAAAASGISKMGIVNKWLARIQNGLFNRTTVWSSISPVMMKRLRAIRKGTQPLMYLPNWLNASLASQIARLPDKVGRPLGSPIRLLYAGNIGAKQGLLDFCKHLQKSTLPFHFQIHGNGSGADAIRAWIKTLDDPRYNWGPFLDETAFAQALHDTDFFVITEKSGSGGSFIPSKMIPGMGSGSAILAVSDATTPLGDEMKTAQPGPWFSWDTLDEVEVRLQSALEDPEPFYSWQKNAILRASFYERNRIIDRFAENLHAMAQGKPITSDY